MEKNSISIVECPRDAIQGIKQFLPTEAKVQYLNQLLKAGFDIIDFGSFVSPKAIPQLSDTEEVLKRLDFGKTNTKLLAIIANEQGAKQACLHPEIEFVGFPFSISETFSLRNIGASILDTFERVKRIQELCLENHKKLVIYLSMAFGNPYGEEWNTKIVLDWVSKLSILKINYFSLADTTGVASSESIKELFQTLIPHYPSLTFGAHFHTAPAEWKEKVDTAYEAGCRWFDTAIGGYGGCPMASDELIGNLPTDKLLMYMEEKGISSQINKETINTLAIAFQKLLSS